jgi:transposase
MFVRVQKVRQNGRIYEYVHLVEGYRDQAGKVRHRVVVNLGRRDRLKDSGTLDNLAGAFTRLDPRPGHYFSGALPLLIPVLRRLDLQGIVDRACPMRGRAHLTHGEVIAALVANRLTSPRPLYDVQGWAEHYAADAWLGTPAALLNDDRLGRALDALSEHLDEVTGALAMAAIAVEGVDAARLHWDFTSLAFCGEYAEQSADAPRIAYGHSSDHQSHRRQLKVAQGVAAAGVPLYHRVVDGGRHEGAETHQLLERLRSLAAPRRLLLVADSALVTKDNLAACHQAKVHFVARLPRSFKYEPAALALPENAFQPLHYSSERSGRLPSHLRPSFRAAEDAIEVDTGAGKLSFRVLYIYGSEEQQAARNNRAKLLWRAEEALARTARGLRSSRKLDHQTAARRVANAVAKGRVGDFLRTELSEDGRELRWWRDEAAIAEAQRRDGLYALITNLGQHEASGSRLLRLFKDQTLVERAHGFLKGPLQVRPVFLHSNRRAAALVAVCAMAVMVYGLIEVQVRRELAPARTIPGLLPEGRAARPTAPNIFAAFASLGFERVRTREGLKELPDKLNHAQTRVLSLLGIQSILPTTDEHANSGCGKRG